MKPQKVSIIITTYNQPEWLRKVLYGFEVQTVNNFEVIIADDGSGSETKETIDWFIHNSKLDIIHVWHPDEGFMKCQILNKSILKSTTEYLIFTDGDCIPRNDFVEIHINKAEKNYFLSGGYFKLSTPVSNTISREDIVAQNPFKISWLLANKQPFTYKFLKFLKISWLQWFLNKITTTKATWNGHNVSGWKDDIVKVNGYNEDMQYGGLDRELGERLMNRKIYGKQIRYNAICIHLDHPRPYRTKQTLDKNRMIRENVRKNNIVWATNGLDKNTKS